MKLYTDASEVKEIIKHTFPEYNGKNISVSTFEGPMELRSYWDSGARDFWSIINLTTNRSKTIPENGSPFIPKVFKISKLPPNFAVVQWSKGRYEQVIVYVNRDNLSKLLPDKKEVSWAEKVVLCVTRSLKSSYGGVSDYRFKEALKDTGITKVEWDQAKTALISKGMLNKAGAITNDGKNVIGRTELYSLKREPTISNV